MPPFSEHDSDGLPIDPPPNRPARKLFRLISLITLSFGVSMLIVQTVGSFNILPHYWPMMAGGVTLGIVAWAIVFRPGLSGASVTRKVAVFIMLPGVAAMLVDGAQTVARTALLRDFYAMGSIKMARNGEPFLPADFGDPGPITRRALQLYRSGFRHDMMRRAAYYKLGYGGRAIDLTTFQDCGRFERAMSRIDPIDREALDDIDRFRRDVVALVGDPKLHADAERWAKSYDRELDKRERRRQLVDQDLMYNTRICSLLAKYGWKVGASELIVSPSADGIEYRRLDRARTAGIREMASFTLESHYVFGDLPVKTSSAANIDTPAVSPKR